MENERNQKQFYVDIVNSQHILAKDRINERKKERINVQIESQQETSKEDRLELNELSSQYPTQKI